MNVIDPINSFVAMFDILGFSQLIKREGTKETYNLFYKNLFIPAIKHSAALKGKIEQREEKRYFVPDFGKYSLEYGIVSDSALIFAMGDELDHFIRIVAASHKLLVLGFASGRTPLRGAIGYGDLIRADGNIWIGSAIIDAYRAEMAQVWAGCAISQKCQDFLERKDYFQRYEDFWNKQIENADTEREKREREKAKNRIVKYNKIPEQYNPKDGAVQYTKREGYVLDWTINMYEDASKNAFRESENQHVQEIISNTTEFETWARAKIE